MQRLKDYVSLDGKIETISMRDLRAGPGDIMSQVELGKTFVIERAKKPIALLCKLPGICTTNVDEKGKITYSV